MKRVLIWGTGKYADVFVQVFGRCINICGYIETNPVLKKHRGKIIYSPTEIKSSEYDFIFLVNTHCHEILNLCNDLEFNGNKIINIFEQKIGIINSDKFEIDFTGENCSEGWITWSGYLLCTNNAQVFRSVVCKDNFAQWWQDVDNNVILSESNQLHRHMEKVVDEWVVPYLSEQDTVLDIGCSNGIIDERISHYCKHIDAYDYSVASIKEAKRRAKNFGIEKISYAIADAKSMSIKDGYSLVILLGLTVCFEYDNDVIDIINKVYLSLIPHGRVLVKESLNVISKDNIYHCNFNNNYQACYRPIEAYEKMWETAGFTVIKKEILADDINIGMVKKYSIGYLFEKT